MILRWCVTKYIQWLEENEATGTKEEFQAKQKEAEAEILPLLKIMNEEKKVDPGIGDFKPKTEKEQDLD